MFKMAGRKALSPKVYQRFLQVCELWPVDKSRIGRDLGAHIKESFGNRLQNAEIDPKEAERALDALGKISSNYYKQKYPRKKDVAFTGDLMKKAGWILSTDYQKEMKQRKTWWEKLVGKKST